MFTHIAGKLVDSVGYTPVFTIVGFFHPVAAIVVVVFVGAGATATVKQALRTP